jgi:hypothetical protein
MTNPELVYTFEPEQQQLDAIQLARIDELLSPQAQHVLGIRYQDGDAPLLIIGCLSVPCGLRPLPDSTEWQFGCPWWVSTFPGDAFFESRLLAEVGKVQQLMDGTLKKLDKSKVN